MRYLLLLTAILSSTIVLAQDMRFLGLSTSLDNTIWHSQGLQYEKWQLPEGKTWYRTSGLALQRNPEARTRLAPVGKPMILHTAMVHDSIFRTVFKRHIHFHLRASKGLTKLFGNGTFQPFIGCAISGAVVYQYSQKVAVEEETSHYTSVDGRDYTTASGDFTLSGHRQHIFHLQAAIAASVGILATLRNQHQLKLSYQPSIGFNLLTYADDQNSLEARTPGSLQPYFLSLSYSLSKTTL